MENVTKETFRERYLKKVREMVKAEGEKRDLFLSQIVETIGDLEKTINQLGMRLKEWYSYYFPELEVNEIEKFARIVLEIDDKKKINIERLRSAMGEGKAERIRELAQKSAGGEIKGEDLVYIKKLARQISDMNDLKIYYEEQIEKISNEIAPNATYLAGGKIVAKLISHAKGLEKIAGMPASTIQVLGAEKALFKYLKKQARKPPKHGIILLHNYVNSLPRHVRGKMARTFAAKLSIAFKADNGKCGFVAKPMKMILDKRYEELKNAPMRPGYREEHFDDENTNENRRDSRPRRSFGDRPERRDFGSRPERRDFGERRSFPERENRESWGERKTENKSFGDRQERRDFGSSGGRERRSFGERDSRPRRSFGDRPERRDFGSSGGRERRSFGERDSRPRRSFGGSDKKFEGRSSGGKGRSFGSGGKRKDRGGGSRRPNSGRGKRRY